MDGLLRTWNALTPMKRVMLGLVTVATVALVLVVAREANRDPMALLYSGLDQAAAGEVVAALDAQGVASEARGASIYVPASARDRVRMDLAAQGLPAKGQDGYELLDRLSGFGTTSEMFDAAYWRAKEGELARTMLAVPGVKQARVHIGSASRTPFVRGGAKPTASVTLKAAGGLDPRTAMSARYLVALAVAGLEPRHVAVIDADNGLVLMPGEDNPVAPGFGDADKRAAALKREIESLLAARVGPDAARVTVSVETSRDSETVSERRIDPDSRVRRSAETSDLSETNRGGGAPVTVASNLPDGDAAQNQTPRESAREETTENVVFDFSETRRETVRLAGAVSRIGVAILVDGVTAADAEGNATWEPRSAEELAALEQLVKSAIGFDEARGDSVTIESLQFVETPQEGVEATSSPFRELLTANSVTLIQVAILALAIVALGLFVVRPILRSGAETAQAAIDAELEAKRLELEAERLRIEATEDKPKNVGEAVERLKQTMTDRADESRALLQRWLEDAEKAAS